MQALQRCAAILLADLRERLRTPRFWVVLVGMSLVVWKCFPGPGADYLVLAVGNDSRGFYSSAWVGMVLAMAFTILLNLGGFYVVRGTLVRDIETRVWQLLVATPMTRAGYLVAKWISHMVVLGAIVLVAMVVGLAAQWLRAEDRHVDLYELAKPIVLISLPGLAMTAMAAIWFDLLPWTRRTAGSVVFFIVWLVSIATAAPALDREGSSARVGWTSDPGGFVLVGREFHRVREEQTGKPQGYGFSVGSSATTRPIERFDWQRWQVRPADVAGRGLWLAIALAGVLLAAPLLDWAAARGRVAGAARSQAGRRLRWLDPLLAPLSRSRLGMLVSAELGLALRQRPIWWWFAALLLLGLQAFGSAEAARIALLLAWVLPLDVLARAVLRESEHGTAGLTFTAANVLPRLLAARFLAGLALLTCLSLPGLLRMAALQPDAALAALVAIVSIVSWGLCLGALLKNPRPFELALVVTTYIALQGAAIGPAWHLAALLPAWLLLAWSWPRLARA